MKKRWEEKVKRTADCWSWTGYRDANGYGRLTVNHNAVLAHRLSWEIFCGPIPEDKRVLHHCDNPSCVRPDHLFLGTQVDNITDTVMKGRYHQRFWAQEKPKG